MKSRTIQKITLSRREILRFILIEPTMRSESKQITADFRHRALRHRAEGIFMAETIFGTTITLSTGRVVPLRWISGQHVREDLGFIPSFFDWVKAIRPEPWMGRAERLDESAPSGPAA